MNKIIIIFFLCLAKSLYANENTIEDITEYLNSIRTFQADFLQEDNLGNSSKGIIYLQKPFRFRVETLEPSHNVIVGNKSLIIYHDYELGETSHTKSDQGAISLLVADHISFNNSKIEVLGFKNDYSTIEIELLDKFQPDIGSMTLVFSKSPIELKQIKTQTDNNKIVMNLYNKQINKEISKNKMVFEYPKVKNPYSSR